MPQGQFSRNRAIPLFAVLMFLVGFGLILAYFKFGALLSPIPDMARWAFFALSGLVVLWSLKHILRALIWGVPQTSLQRKSDFRVMLTRPGFAYLLLMMVMFIGAMLGRSNLLMLVFALMAGPFVLNGWVTFSMLRFTDVKRITPKQAIAGEPISVEIAFKNSKRLLPAWLMIVTDRIQNDHEYLEAHAMFTRVAARSERRAYYRLKLMHRGKYHFGPFRVRTRFPLGLIERSQEYTDHVDVLVYPRIGRLAKSWRKQLRHASDFVEHQATQQGLYDDEFHHIREYRPGDNLRSIHWRTTARQDDLMVRQHQQTRDQSLTVLVDLWQPEFPSEEDLERVEYAASLAATMCMEHFRNCRDSKLYLVVSGKSVRSWTGESGMSSVDSAFEILAMAEANPKPNSENMWKEAFKSHALETSAVLVSTRSADNQPTVDWQSLSKDMATFNVAGNQRPIQHIEADPEKLASIFDLSN